MDEIIDYIIRSYNALWKVKKYGNTIEIVTPISTTNNMFVSVFLTKRGDEYVITDGGWIDSGMYECEVGLEDIYYSRLFQYYLEDYDIQCLDAKGYIYYYKKVADARFVPNVVYDLSNFINAVVSASFITFEERKEKEHTGKFKREATSYIKSLVEEKNIKTNFYIHESISMIRFNAVVYKRNRMNLINYITGANDITFILSLGRSNLGYDTVDNNTMNSFVDNKITLFDDTTKIHQSSKVRPLLETVGAKAGRLCLPWRERDSLKDLVAE